MAKINININIDKLRLCYIQPEHLVLDIMDRAGESDWIDYGNFSLHLIEEEREDDKVKQVTADLFIHGVVQGHDKTLLGTFVFNNTAKYEGRCFFSFDNRALYTTDSVIRGSKNNLMGYLPYVTNSLNLTLNNVTELELAVDTNLNVIRSIRKFIRDYDQYEMFLNGNIVHNHTKRIGNYCEIFDRSRVRLGRTPTLYVKQAGIGVPFHLKAYNKTAEMTEESPHKLNYINGWNEFGSEKKTYRIEVTMGNTDFRTWISSLHSAGCTYPIEWSEPMNTLDLLMGDEYKWALWVFCCRRLLYFRNRDDGTIVTLLDIVGGQKP